jgi:hypothetical protein
MIERRHQPQKRKWVETWGAVAIAISATATLMTGAYGFYQAKIHDPHVNDLIDAKIKPVYDKIKETNAQVAKSIETSDRIFYMLSQHLSPGEKVRASRDYDFYKGKKDDDE